ncbi:pseudouridylate synthase [Methylovirgula ligni]|uniref:Pseudouridine synthase n=1 Tax=Methylovirgula ligni TaxID=569860 RepID=A0A3D9YZR9_9HYPH|nr:pseudouridine synthase [Methylovirgula ligni]QAY95953.1 pseudouridylate synthase [Methylovirgula ligni]REF86382.1 23S rRNA pseudouridine2605 synthase [Methylovirgula ligni]
MRQEHGRPDKPKLHKPRRAVPRAAAPSEKTGDRIAKVIARVGLCSRRDAEAWIAEGRVAVNGAVLTSPALNVGPDDKVEVDGKPLAQRQRTRLFLFHKPRGLVTTNKDPEGRSTIFDYLAEHHAQAPRLVSIGRLDINTEGLLLLTNDGGLARLLELPSTGWLRRYRVRANGTTDQAQLDTLRQGLTLDGIHYAGIEATLDREQGANVWLTMSLREGKNREIKRVLEHLGLFVNRLIRLSYGPFQLGDLADGALEEVRGRVLRDQLGEALLKESGADLDAPIDAEPVREEKRPPPRGVPAPAARGASAARGPAPRGKIRAHRPPVEAEPDKPRHRPLPGPRKHVSALRAQQDEGRRGKRQRIERATTEDRKGRAVAVERHVAAVPAKKPRNKTPRPDSRPNARPEVASNARPNTRADARPDKRRDARPDTRAGTRPDTRPNKRQDARPDKRADGRPEKRPSARPDGRPSFRPGGAKRPQKPGRPSGGPRRPGAR